jgi:anti-anti-sigma factor
VAEPPVIEMQGELNLHAARALAPQLNEVAGTSDPWVVMDLSSVTFIDSTSLATILQAHQRLERQGRTLSLVVPDGSAAAVVLDLSGLRSRFSVFSSRQAAVAGSSDGP